MNTKTTDTFPNTQTTTRKTQIKLYMKYLKWTVPIQIQCNVAHHNLYTFYAVRPTHSSNNCVADNVKHVRVTRYIYYLKTEGGGGLGNSWCGKNDGIHRTEIWRRGTDKGRGAKSVSISGGGTHPLTLSPEHQTVDNTKPQKHNDKLKYQTHWHN